MPPCHHSSAQSWTLASLIGSYLDLALAYLFLIGSTLVFLASKFLSLFGLALRCPCADGLFGHPDCVQTLLLDSTGSRIESLRTSIRTRFPFDVIFNGHIGSEPDRKPLTLTGPEGDGEDRIVAGNRVESVVGRRIRRRRVSGWRKGKSSVSPPMRLSWQGEGFGDNFGCQSKEENSVGVLRPEDGQRAAEISEDGVSMVDQSPAATEFFSVEDMSSATRDVQPSNASMELIIKNLERELEESQSAYAALYLELEKERSAAATAADEAMAMILRLQSEKAAVKMESRQYQRIIEEKSAYDEEEMEILKDIIVRRECEKHVLEKEVEAYRLMLSGEITGEKPDSLFNSSDDPTLMLKTICDSIRKKENAKSKMKWADDGGLHYPDLPSTGEECNIEFQEKGIVTITKDVYPSGHCQRSSFGDIGCKLNRPQELGFCKESSCLSGEEDAGKANKVETRIPVDELDREDRDADQRDSYSSQFETESSVLDVHVIEDKNTLDDKDNGKASNMFKVVHASEISEKYGMADELPGMISVDLSTKTPAANWVEVEQVIQRSCSDMTKGCKLMDTLSDNATHVDLRRSSMSAIDSERFKLEDEVETLRKRLKTIQKGRENLSFPLENREKETFQLQILEEVACQLPEIRRITEPGKSIHQASLTSQSSKAKSKKRRCRSVSWGLHDSA